MQKLKFSIIIPLAPNETAHANLCSDISKLCDPKTTEVILVVSSLHKTLDIKIPLLDKTGITYRIYRAKTSRAIQMNTGAKHANGTYVWFLHADTRITQSTINTLENIEKNQKSLKALYYFKLKFLNDGPYQMRLNELGVRMRCLLFNIPFGDQGFLLSKKTFKELGYYNSSITTGEDFYLIKKAKQKEIQVLQCESSLLTSARRYTERGWYKTTLHNLGWLLKHQSISLMKLRRLRQ